jgi:hypothetical protein
MLGVVGALVAWGLWSNVALATWVQNLKEPGFTEWRYEIDGAVFGDPAPALQRIDTSTSVPRNGVVGLDVADDGTCRGVYIAEDGKWNALDRSEGASKLTGVLTHVDGVVATGDGWELTVATVLGGAHVRFRLGENVSAALPLDLHGGPIEVELIVDRVEGTTRVTLDGREALFGFGAPPLPMKSGPVLDAVPAGPSRLCRQLTPRL